jgi:hypothetical protein
MFWALVVAHQPPLLHQPLLNLPLLYHRRRLQPLSC